MEVYIPKFKEIYNKEPIVRGRVGVSGRFRCKLTNERGEGEWGAWQDNLITDYGLDQCRRYNWGNRLVIGSGNTAPAFTDTELVAALGIEDSKNYVSGNTPSAPNYERIVTRNFTFNAGTATGTIRELGLHDSNSAPYLVSTRALLAAPIVKGVADQLDIEYQITLWPDVTDSTGVIAFDGVDYDYISRISNCTVAAFGSYPTIRLDPNVVYQHTFEGSVGAITTYPPGTYHGLPSSFSTVYGGTLGTYYTEHVLTWSVDNSNGDTIGAIWDKADFGNQYTNYWNAMGYQSEIAKVSDGTGLDKLNTHELTMTFRLLPSRH
jgi:hypothetical protein